MTKIEANFVNDQVPAQNDSFWLTKGVLIITWVVVGGGRAALLSCGIFLDRNFFTRIFSDPPCRIQNFLTPL